MEIRAYNELYLEGAMSALGTMFDYAVNYNNREIDDFVQAFLNAKDLSRQFETGQPNIVVGKSGVELYYLLVGKSAEKTPDYVEFNRSPEYWVGWALAYCQWYMNRTFREITAFVKPSEMIKWYPIYHEMDISHVVSAIEERMKKMPTNLERLRKKQGYSQTHLAELSTVSRRSIQAYEQRRNDITKAQFNTLNALAKVLKCSINDLVGDKITE